MNTNLMCLQAWHLQAWDHHLFYSRLLGGKDVLPSNLAPLNQNIVHTEYLADVFSFSS